MPEDWFGEAVAATYDEDVSRAFDPVFLATVVDTLAELADGGSALEFAIGTGRVALPLSARGVPVSGIELSAAMVARLRSKPGGGEEAIPVVIGDMASTEFGPAESFSLVYLLFNTIMNLTTQEAQVACFRNAARHLGPAGVFVVETSVPRLRSLPPGQRFVPFDVSERHLGVDEYHVADQTLISHHMTFRHGTVDRVSVPFRYVWPSELDLMAKIAGMRLRDRWSDWRRTPFGDESLSHVSLWEKFRP
jgi:SAM-dependent methyltransferase